MKNFMMHDFAVNTIELATIVKAGKGAMVHKNRKAHGLAIFLGGERLLCFDQKKILATQNTVVYFPKGSNYTVREKSPSDCYAINFQLPEGVCFEPFSFKIKNANAVLESFKSSQKTWAKKKSGYTAKVKSELYNIIYHIQSEYSIPYGNPSVIEPAIEYIHSNYDKETVSVAHLAALCKISTVHLCNTFVKVFAMSPVKYLNHLRMSRARELLSSGMYTVSEVCFLSGYNNESYFSREFKKQFNISPSQYKKTSHP